MTSTENRAQAADRSMRNGAQWLIGLLIVLALIASVVMVAIDDLSAWASVAVIAALWAAVIAVILMTRYRRQADVATKRGQDLRLVYELQLEREIAARRQYEADVEGQIRAEIRDEQNEEFEALKAQVLALRASLEQVLGNPLPEVPLALRPERRRELGSGLSGAGYVRSGDDRVAADRDFASTAAPGDAGRHQPTAAEAIAQSSESELTEIIPVVTEETSDDAGYPVEEPAAGYAPAEAPEPPVEYSAEYEQPAVYEAEAEVEDVDETTVIHQVDDGPTYGGEYPSAEFSSVEYGAVDYSGYQQQPATYDAAAYQPPVVDEVPVVEEQPGDRPADEAPARSRRARADGDDDGAHAVGRPASELLSQLRAAGGTSGGGGRRRRD